MTVTALFATAGATNSGLYPATGLGDEMAAAGSSRPSWAAGSAGGLRWGSSSRRSRRSSSALFFDLNAIASIGSAVALVVFTLVTFGHFRIRHETGAQAWLLVVADLTTVVVLVAFALTTLVDEPGTAVALVVILLLERGARPDVEASACIEAGAGGLMIRAVPAQPRRRCCGSWPHRRS